MRLKTKFQDEDFDLGEVVEANIYYGGDGRIKVVAEPTRGGIVSFYFESLKGLNEMFEDAPEEPESKIEDIRLNDMISGRHIVEIDFTEVEEAEKAVLKLKAWKRLEDKGFRVTLQGCKGNAWLQANWGNLQGDYSDVLLLFGGEE